MGKVGDLDGPSLLWLAGLLGLVGVGDFKDIALGLGWLSPHTDD